MRATGARRRLTLRRDDHRAALRLLAHPDHVRAGHGRGGAAGRAAGRRCRRGVGRGPARRGRPYPAGAPHARRRHHRPAAGRAERAHRGARVRRRGMVGARRRHLVRRLGRPAAVPARPRRRAGADHPRAGRAARRPLRRRRRRPGRGDDRLRAGAARGAVGGRRAQRDGPARAQTPVGAGGAGQRPGLRGGAAPVPGRRARWPGCSGTTRRCRGTTRSWWCATWRPARRRWWPAGRGSRCPEPRCRAGRLAAGSCPTARDWWNLYRWTPGADIAPVVRLDAEIGVPALGVRVGPLRACSTTVAVVFARWRDGHDGLAVRQIDGTLVDLDVPFSAIAAVRAAGPDAVVVVAGQPDRRARRAPGRRRRPSAVETLRRAARPRPGPGAARRCPSTITFDSVDGDGAPRTAHALFYPPASRRLARAGRRAPAAAGADPRRPDLGRDAGAEPRRAVLDEPRLRRGRRRLRRLHRLRPRLPARSCSGSGA